MALIGRQNSEVVRGGSRGNGDVLKAGVMSARSVKHQASVPRLFNSERQDAAGVEMFHRCEPAAQVLRFRRRLDSDSAGDACLDLGNGDCRNIEPVIIGA